MACLKDDLFNKDLKLKDVTLLNFTPRSEFELTNLFKRVASIMKEGQEINENFIYDNVDFSLIEKIGKWMDENSDINNVKNYVESGDLMNKVLYFLEVYLDYDDFKKKLKKQ